MAAAIQGFPSDWRFSGRKTASYRQVGNAFPPPVARAVGESIAAAIQASRGRSSGSVVAVGSSGSVVAVGSSGSAGSAGSAGSVVAAGSECVVRAV
jgi:hypothetical protein